MFSVFYDFSTVKIYLAARQLDNGIFTFIASAENGVDTIDKLFALAASQILMMVGMYYISAAVVTGTQDYNFILSPLFVFKEVGFIAVSTIPMLAFFWLLSVSIQTPIFSIGIGLASIVPSVLMINTKAWFAYPMSYPFFVITSEYGKLATNLTTSQVELFPWIPVAIAITIVCLCISCFRFGQAERR